MARVPTDPGRNTLPSVPSVRIPVADGIAQGLGAIGGALTEIGVDALRRSAAAEAQKALAEVRDDWSQRQLELEEAAPLGAEGHANTVEKTFDEDAAARIEAAHPLARDWLSVRVADERSRILDRANRFETGQRLEKRKQDTLDAIELNANAVRSDPARFDDALTSAREAIENSGLTEASRAALSENAEMRVTAALVQSLNETDPLQAKALLEGGELDAFLTPEAKHALTNDNQVELRRRDAAAKALVVQAKAEIREVVDLLEAGFDPGRDRLQRLAGVARADEGLADDLGDAVELYEFQRVARELTPSDLQGWINKERGRLNAKSGVKQVEAARITMAENLLSTMNTGIRTDPLSWAARAGTHQVAPLTLVGEEADASIGQRKQDAFAVAAYYGIQPRYLTDEEAQQLSEVAEGKDLDTKLALVVAVSNGFGPATAPQVFREIAAKGAPTLAHAGGLALTGDAAAARDGLAGLQLLADKSGAPPPAGTPAYDFEALAGTAFALQPSTGGRVREFARGIYAARAARRGLAADVLDKDLWERSVQEAAGAVYLENGARMGGIVDFNGRRVVVPRDIAADQFTDVVNMLSDEDLAGAAHGDGTPLTAADLHDGFFSNPDVWLVSAGHGRYRVAVTDPALGDPEWIGVEGGTVPYVLDLRILLPALRARAGQDDGSGQ